MLLLHNLPGSSVCFLRVKTTDVPQKHKLAEEQPTEHYPTPADYCSLLSLGGTITQCREAAPTLFPSLDKAVATTDRRVLFAPLGAELCEKILCLWRQQMPRCHQCTPASVPSRPPTDYQPSLISTVAHTVLLYKI